MTRIESPPERTCSMPGCGVVYKPKAHYHLFCTPECVTSARICAVCGNPFKTSHYRTKTCSVSCRKELRLRRLRISGARFRVNNREACNEKQRIWREKNLERSRAYSRAHYHANKQELNDKVRAWRDVNPDKVKQWHKRRSIKLKEERLEGAKALLELQHLKAELGL